MIGWAVLYGLVAMVVLFVIGKVMNYTTITDKWSTALFTSLMLLLITLATVNGSYIAGLNRMSMCNDSIKNLVKVSMSILASITIILAYMIYYEFGTNDQVSNYLMIMIHVNILCSLLTLCLVIMRKLAGIGIQTKGLSLVN